MSDSIEAVKSALCRRTLNQHMDLVAEFGINRVMDAIEEQAEFSGGRELEEIGSSDVSCWMMEVENRIRRSTSVAA